MLERIDKLVFYFQVECALCKNVIKVSHVVIEEQNGMLICSLCGRNIKVPDAETLVKASKALNEYLGDSINSKFVKLVLNEKFKIQDELPLAGGH